MLGLRKPKKERKKKREFSTNLRPLPINVSGNQDWTLWKSNIGTQGDGFQLNNFKVAQGNFCDVVNIGLGGS